MSPAKNRFLPHLLPQSQPYLKYLPLFILLGYVLLSIFSFWTSTERELINNFEDDAYYYFKIARNVDEIGKLSFDGHTITNGFHPLWLITLLPFFLAIDDPILVLRVVGTFSALVVGGTAYLAWRYTSRRYSLLSVCLVGAILLACLIAFGSIGMETTILLPFLTAALIMIDRSQLWLKTTNHHRDFLALGLILALVQLARLDAVLLNLVVVLFIGLSSPWPVVWKNLFWLGLPIVMTGLAYLTFNFLGFGHLVSTAGLVKSMGNNLINDKFLDQLTNPVNPDGTVWLVYTGMLLLAIGYLGALAWRKWQFSRVSLAERHYLPLMISIFFILFTGYQLFGTSWILWRWYAYPLWPMGMVVAPLLLDHILQRLHSFETLTKTLKLLTFMIVTIVLLEMAVLASRWGYWRNPVIILFPYDNYLIAEELNQRLEQPVIAAMGDRAGSFGYFFKGDVLQLEGLVGEYEILTAIKNNNLMAYMTDFGVELVVSHVGPPLTYDRWTLLNPLPKLSTGPYADINLCAETELLRYKTAFSSIYIWQWPSCPTE